MSTKKIAELTGLSAETIDKIVSAQTDFQLALGIAHGDADAVARGDAVRRKYPDLLRGAVGGTARRSPSKPVTFELEATIVQLESGESVQAVVDVIAAYNEVNGLVDPPFTAQYRQWAKKWTSR